MTRRLVTAIAAVFAACLVAAPVHADYPSDRRAAVALARAGKTDEALAAFVALAGTGSSDVQKTDALRQAVSCAVALKRFDRAEELASAIPLAPAATLCWMNTLDSQRRWKELVETFGGEDLGAWPESLRGEGSFVRGQARLALKNAAAAARDLARANDYLVEPNMLGLCRIALGDALIQLPGKEAEALAAWRSTYETGNVYKHCEAAVHVARHLRGVGRPDAAVAEFARIDRKQVEAPFWKGRLLCAEAQALADMGDRPKAATRYREALGIADLPDEIRKECEAGLKKVAE